MSPRTGRPTDNPRPHKLSIRLSDADKEILEKYCVENNVNRTEAISRAINLLKKKIGVAAPIKVSNYSVSIPEVTMDWAIQPVVIARQQNSRPPDQRLRLLIL